MMLFLYCNGSDLYNITC